MVAVNRFTASQSLIIIKCQSRATRQWSAMVLRREVLRVSLLLVAKAPIRPRSAVASDEGLPLAMAGPDSNGAMEQRFLMGLPAFTPAYPEDPDPGLPTFPVLGAQANIERLLENEVSFRKLIVAGFPTGSLQLPPILAPSLFETLEGRVADPPALRVAAKTYLREARDADELIAFAIRSRAEDERERYLDGGLAALRRCQDALRQIVVLLPNKATTGEPVQALRQQTESLIGYRR